MRLWKVQLVISAFILVIAGERVQLVQGQVSQKELCPFDVLQSELLL